MSWGDARVGRIARSAPNVAAIAALLAWAAREMCVRRYAVCLVCAVCLIICAATGGRAEAAPFDPKGEDWEGLSQWLGMAEVELGGSRAIATSTLDLHRLEPTDAVVLVHPTRTLDVEGLSAFMRAGGRVVLLDDYGTGDALLAKFDIHRRPLPDRPAEMLRGNPALAIAEPAADLHQALRDLSQVVTNHATGLDQHGLSPILVVRGSGEADVLLSIAGVVGRGRLLAVGDASVVINSMLRYPGNRALALAIVRYALEDEPSGKSGKLYVLANDFETTGAFGDQPPFAGAASEVGRAIADTLEALRHDGLAPAPAYVVALGVGIGVLVWTGARAGKTHKHATPRFARTVPVVAQGGIAGHAAVLGSPGTSRALAILELKSALEEELATHLGLDRAPSADQLVARLRGARLLDESGARTLSRLLATMARVETRLASRGGRALGRHRPSDADVLAIAVEVRDIRRRIGLQARA